MSSWSKYTLSEKRTLLEQASEKTGVSDTIIEKDWWVTTLLKALSLSSCKGSFSFKGGTSLSKGWKLIRRFSEDIDIAIDKSFFGITQSNKNQRDKLRKNARTYIEQKLISELKNIIHSFGVNEFEINYVSAEDSDKDPTVVLVPYKSILSRKDDYAANEVKIEFSCRSLNEPCKGIIIQSMIEESIPSIDSESRCSIRTVIPTRTFLEKIFLLHEEFQKNHVRTLRMTRHLYDLEALMDTEFGKEALNSPELYAEIVRHRSIYTAIHGIDYSKHIPSMINIVPPESIINEWLQDYKTFRQSFVYGDAPTFDKLIDRIKILQERIHKMKVDLSK